MPFSQVNTTERYALLYWSSEFGVTPQQLRDAVQAVGTDAVKVREYLKCR
jgi:hypothetical protein